MYVCVYMYILMFHILVYVRLPCQYSSK